MTACFRALRGIPGRPAILGLIPRFPASGPWTNFTGTSREIFGGDQRSFFPFSSKRVGRIRKAGKGPNPRIDLLPALGPSPDGPEEAWTGVVAQVGRATRAGRQALGPWADRLSRRQKVIARLLGNLRAYIGTLQRGLQPSVIPSGNGAVHAGGGVR